jgi:anti-sigma-K factor RskA
MTETPLTAEEADRALAGEYVLGVLDAAERAAVEARLRRDPGFAAEVAAWEVRFSGLDPGFAEAPPPPDLLPRIEARLFGRPVPAASPATAAGGGWLARLLFGAGALAAAAFAAIVLLAPLPPAGPVLVATLQGQDGPLAFDARYEAGVLTVSRTGGTAAPEGQAHELWLIVGSAAPVSLGLLDAATVARPVAAIPEGATLAVSLEPAGGSPTGAPTGAVLALGAVVAG